jgi:hypothetical protein
MAAPQTDPGMIMVNVVPGGATRSGDRARPDTPARHSTQWETNFHERIGTPQTTIATAVRTTATATSGPAGLIWQPAGISGPRRTLADLRHVWTGRTRTPHPGSDSDRDFDSNPHLDW